MIMAGIAACTTAHRSTNPPQSCRARRCRPATLVREQVGLPVDKRDMLPAEPKLAGEAIAVLEAWVKKQAK